MSTQADRAAVRALNRRAREGAGTDDYFGHIVEDPYRSLEEESAATTAWMDAQTARTERALAAYADPARTRRMEELFMIRAVSAPRPGGARVFYTKREGDSDQ